MNIPHQTLKCLGTAGIEKFVLSFLLSKYFTNSKKEKKIVMLGLLYV